MKVAIITVDTDYHQYTGTTLYDFESIIDAEEWCSENSFGGEFYSVDKKETKRINSNQQ